MQTVPKQNEGVQFVKCLIQTLEIATYRRDDK